MDLLAEVKALQRRRDAHLDAIVVIDGQLADVRRVLGIEPSPITERPAVKRARMKNGHCVSAVLTALVSREPQTSTELAASTGCSYASVRQALVGMVCTRQIVERKSRMSDSARLAKLYARTEEGFAAVVNAEQEAAAADEAIPG